MARDRSRRRAGRSPGLVTHEDVEGHAAPRISVFSYAEDRFEERQDAGVKEALALAGPGRTTWINVDGLGDLDLLEHLWDAFGVHPLVREDVVNLHQRPKFEEYKDQGHLVVQMAVEGSAPEQVGVVFGDHWILTFQERQGDVFDPVRERLRKGRQRIRSSGPDYLVYALLDAVVDGYFPLMEAFGERVEEAEQECLAEPTTETIEKVHRLRRDLLAMRRALWPTREAVQAMQRADPALVAPETQTYLRDVYDHGVRAMDMLETFRELASGLADAYYSTLSHRMNEAMRVLTVVATIFIPLTFIAGVYGMNFEHMPELGWRPAYFVVLAGMGALGLVMGAMFHRKGWI